MLGISSRGGLLTNPYYPFTPVGCVVKKSPKKRGRRVLNPVRSIFCYMRLKALPARGCFNGARIRRDATAATQ
jgi:hypothetical protein